MRRRRPNNPLPADGSPIKTIFGLYQCLHHLSILTGNANTGKPKPFERKADELDRFFRPALSDLTIRQQINETNREWSKKQTENLIGHYTWQSEALKGCISAWNLTSSELNSHLTKAREWVKQHFRQKFRKNIFDQVDKIVRNFAKSETVRGSSGFALSNPPTDSQRAPTATESGGATASTPAQSRKRDRPASSPDSSPTQLQTPKKTRPTPSSSYSNVAASPPFGPNANKPKLNKPQAVNRFPRLPPRQRGEKVSSLLATWEIPKIAKNILVLGTSNLSRISFVKRRDAQILSYPGLKMDYLLKLLSNFKFGPASAAPGLKPTHVVISVGLNDRLLAPTTNEVNIRKVLNEAKRQFPGSKISFHQIRFNSKLPANQIETIRKFNDAIERISRSEGLKFIPGIPLNKFATDPKDKTNIHWSEDCANRTIEHIFDHLN